jgi:predicted O-methyltransferase YrrM
LLARASDVIQNIGQFDLIFVDASPMKFDEIEFPIRALRAGGKLCLDDLSGKLTGKAKHFNADHERLRQFLSNHPELHYVFLDWSTGVVLATKAIR